MNIIIAVIIGLIGGSVLYEVTETIGSLFDK